MNQIKKGNDLRLVVMPIVDVIRDGDLSWEDKKACADAIRSVVRHWKSMEEERVALNMANAMGCLPPGVKL